MLFNSLDFAIFLPIVFTVYWLLHRSLKWQNALIVAASYVFYGWWDWRFLSLIAFSTLVDFLVGMGLRSSENQTHRKILLWTSIGVNLGLLGFFKYYNFFLDNFIQAFSLFGRDISAGSLEIILPVGISFYTFQTLSYSIDVYRRKLEPTSNFIAFAAYVSFFPQLVAGPIERATQLLPQFFRKRAFSYPLAVDGLRQILWGLFKKMVIADNCAVYANLAFEHSDTYPGSALFLGALFFTFQIYGDFSGYSDIAIGTSKLFGFRLMQNFAFPYFSRDIAEFWRRWHISLSTWFRDYLYIPLGGSRGGRWQSIRNVFIIFIVSGFWHGANWTFVVWGALNAAYFLPLMLAKRNRANLDVIAAGRWLPGWKDFLRMLGTFLLTVLTWVFFRAQSIQHAFEYLGGIFSESLFSSPLISPMKIIVCALIAFMVAVEWLGRKDQYGIEKLALNQKWWMRWIFYGCIIMLIVLFAPTEETPFIYFQF